MKVGVIEIKCRNGDYPTWMISRGKMEMLYTDYQMKGFPAMLAFAAMSDGEIKQVYLADMRVLIADREKWREADNENMMTTNHGNDRRKKTDVGYLLPRELFWRMI